MISLKRAFLPGGTVFFGLFNDIADNLKEMSLIFHAAVDRQADNASSQILEKMGGLEHENSILIHRISLELNKNFITPLDRTDMHALAIALGGITEYLWKAVRQICVYEFRDPGNYSRGIAELLQTLSLLLTEAIHELPNKHSHTILIELCLKANQHTKRIAGIVEDGTNRLMQQGRDAIEVIKLKDHLEALETLIQKYNETVIIFESIALKYS